MDRVLGVLLLTTCLASSCNAEYSESGLPFAVNILRKNKVVCTGSIISDGKFKVAITAAHCVYGHSMISLQVDKNKQVNPETVIVHPHYAPPSVEYDIALIKFKLEQIPNDFSTNQTTTTTLSPTTEKPLPNTPEIDISEVEPKDGATAKHIVWHSNNTMFVIESVNVMNRKMCQAKYKGIVVVSSKMICADSKSPQVQGGNALIYENKVVGVGVRTFGSTFPRIYINLANQYIRSFIMKYL